MRIDQAIRELIIKPHPRFKDRLISKYIIARKVGVTPPMIDRWLEKPRTSVNQTVVDKFKSEFDIEITFYQTEMDFS